MVTTVVSTLATVAVRRSCQHRAQDSVDDTLQLTEDQPLIMMSRDAGAIHCDFAYDFNAAMISNSITTVHSVSHNGRRWRRVGMIDCGREATRKGSIVPKRQHIYSS